MASRLLARRRLLHFIQRLDPTYMAGWVHKDICKRLERFSDEVTKGLSPRLMLLMPPRHGKSRIASVAFPAWHLGRNPDHEFISSSYNVGLAMSFSRKCQAILEDPRYPFENTSLDPNNKSAETWGLHGRNGAYVAAGVGGGITGKGAHILSIDDPIKNHEEADSAIVREALWDWYGSTAYTRLAPGGGVLVIQTCWHDDDLAGRLQQVMAANPDDPDTDQFEIVRYPAIAEQDEWEDNFTEEIIRVDSKTVATRADIAEPTRLIVMRTEAVPPRPNCTLLRIKGEPLHAERYDLAKLSRIMKTLSNRFWSALYQQNSVPDDGAFFMRENFKRATLPSKEACNVYMTFDFAITEKQHNDYTVGAVGLQDQDDMLHVADMVRFKSGDSFFIVEAIISLIKKWRTSNLRLGFENGQIFLALQAQLVRRMREEKLYVPYETLQPVTDKKVRAAPLQGRMQQGRVCYAEGAEWFPVMQAEMLRFPSGVHDDMVDAQAWMARLVSQYESPRKPTEQKLKSWKDNLPRDGKRGISHMAA